MVAVGTGRVTSQTEMATGLGLADKLPEWERVYGVAESMENGGFGVGEGGGVVGAQ